MLYVVLRVPVMNRLNKIKSATFVSRMYASLSKSLTFQNLFKCSRCQGSATMDSFHTASGEHRYEN